MFSEMSSLSLTLIGRLVGLWMPILCILSGCTSISVEPSCPDELEVGQSGTVMANERNPGEIPTYAWEAFPADAGTFNDSSAPNTSFLAQKEGEVVIRLTASDGLYQMIAECRITVVPSVDVSVSFQVDPDPAVLGESAILFCSSVGETEAVTLTLEQVDGPMVTLSPLSEGVATFTPQEIGELAFSCVGATEEGRQSEPSVVTVSVTASPNGNGNDNTNENDNGTDNENDNNGRRPPRPGR